MNAAQKLQFGKDKIRARFPGYQDFLRLALRGGASIITKFTTTTYYALVITRTTDMGGRVLGMIP